MPHFGSSKVGHFYAKYKHLQAYAAFVNYMAVWWKGYM